jgi:hypothetical protein
MFKDLQHCAHLRAQISQQENLLKQLRSEFVEKYPKSQFRESVEHNEDLSYIYDFFPVGEGLLLKKIAQAQKNLRETRELYKKDCYK